MFLTQNPAIDAIYQFQQQLHSLLMKRALTQRACREVIPTFLDMLTELKLSAFKALASLGKTLSSWKDEVARMWRFSKMIRNVDFFYYVSFSKKCLTKQF